jgi:hypothetical protein
MGYHTIFPHQYLRVTARSSASRDSISGMLEVSTSCSFKTGVCRDSTTEGLNSVTSHTHPTNSIHADSAMLISDETR